MWYLAQPVSTILETKSGQKLYLGNVQDARDLIHWNPLSIQAILDVSTEEPYNTPPSIRYLKVAFHDGHEIREDQFSLCMAFLKDCWESNLNVLVHCAAGISRSTSIVVSFLQYMELGQMFTPPLNDMDKLLEYVALCRPIVNPAKLTLNSCKKWLLQYPYDGSFGIVTSTLPSRIRENLLRMHPMPTCGVRLSILADDNGQRHLLSCTCQG